MKSRGRLSPWITPRTIRPPCSHGISKLTSVPAIRTKSGINPRSHHKVRPPRLAGRTRADAAHGLNDARRAGVSLELAPQPQDLHIDGAVEDIFMHTGRLQQVLAAERSLRRVKKNDQ